MNNTKYYYLVLLLILALLPYGCEHKRDMSALPKLSARDQAIYTTPAWIIYTKEGEKVAQIRNVPGDIANIAITPGTTPTKTHPFIDMVYYTIDGDDHLPELLNRAHNFDEYVSLLKDNGYKVVLNPYDKKPFWKYILIFGGIAICLGWGLKKAMHRVKPTPLK